MRFAPLVRVSTETQETQGESLRTQKQQIIQAVVLAPLDFIVSHSIESHRH